MKKQSISKDSPNTSTESHMGKFTTINLLAEDCYIPHINSKSRLVLDLVLNGISRNELAIHVKNFHGAPLQKLEGKRFGYWLIDRYINELGEKSLIANYRHLSGDKNLDREARRIRRKDRAIYCDEKNKKEVQRTPVVQLEHSEAQKEYFLSLGVAANESEKPTQKDI
ncbi:hypothetical protein [Psychromonas sp. Urea-02u-13]|uniref:hypothetical protein n=1 Tax=Psychromonas sp. Urea-02u-13 TaxID=2058326 RepID=UPI000C34C8C4|nr:hypothetical protein [Psychromonas sp. Urea-02u-13]PKG37641.1 hypothetical protein CXF74_17865 [Psychromonas sp. Urea-02u-13]